jgi:protein involved in polysaccharide export with SLBB domain
VDEAMTSLVSNRGARSKPLLRVALPGLVALVLAIAPRCGWADDAAAYRLGTGDKVRVTVFGEKDLSGDFDVNDQGVVALPLIGPTKLAGKTISEAEAQITQSYGKDYLVNPRVNVEVLNYRPFFILGEVKNPGSYPFVNGMTVVNAVALAGGYTPRAKRDHIMVKRAAKPSAGEQEVSEDAAILPGDVIRVPERFF